MGVPTFFLSIIRNKYYKNVHSGVKNGKVSCDYFCMDYNGIVYSAYERIKKNLIGKSSPEDMIIDEVIRYTKYLICEVVKPNKLTYIALDGPAPRAKMVQQRSRRYKGYFEKVFLKSEGWDRSANISPGTEFMEKLSNRLLEIIKVNGFSVHNPAMEVIFSNSNVPGEGEHKFLPIIRSMRKIESTKNAKVYLYGSDADLIVLAVSTHKNNMHVIREVNVETPDMKKLYESYEYIDINIDNLSNAFNNDLTKTFKNVPFNKVNILNDYILLTFLAGNDFVISMSFLKIKKDGLKTLIAIYNDIKIKYDNYLVIYNPDESTPPTINIMFFKELVLEISKKEDMFMKEQQLSINRLMSGKRPEGYLDKERDKTPEEIFRSNFSHLEVCSPDHPLHSKYAAEFLKIDYSKDYEVWKEEYYNYYLNVNKKNEEEYLRMRMNIVENYLESLSFALKYYFQGCPDWRWHYRFRIAPLFSDIYYALDKFDMNNFNFDLRTPYTPFQQLMLILPPQMDGLVPAALRPIMNNDKLLCTQFYPIDFNLDVTVGIKTIYSEAILPEINEELLMEQIASLENKLTAKERERNTIRNLPFRAVKR